MKYKRTKTADFGVLARRFLHDYMPITRNLSDKSVEAYKQSLKIYLEYHELEQGILNLRSREIIPRSWYKLLAIIFANP